MKEILEKMWKYAFGGIVVFLFGIFVGYRINLEPKESLQGNIFRAVPSATYSNLVFSTTPNATMYNATNGNATMHNATSVNYRQSYNLLILSNFRTLDPVVNAGDRENITLITQGARLVGGTLYFEQDNGTYSFSAPIIDAMNFPYVIIPKDVPSGYYYVSRVFAVGRNYDYTTFPVTYSGDYIVKERIQINNGEIDVSLDEFALQDSYGEIGDKVYLTYSLSTKPQTIKLSFTKIDGEVMVVNVRSLNDNPYFMIPSTTTAGDYRLDTITISTNDGLKVYSIDAPNDENLLEDVILLTVNDGTNSSYVYDNNSIETNSDILNLIYIAPENINIVINAESNSLISEELFNTIKGTNKKLVISYEDNEMVFSGEDIDTPKLVDASIIVKELSENRAISKIVDDGVIISFSDNGSLPGKASVRIKANDLLNEKIGNNKSYLYLYNEETEDFTPMDTEVTISEDGYYEFTISHNSDYVLVTKQIDNKYIAETANVVSFQRGDRTNIILIICGVVLIIGVSVAIAIIQKKSKKVKE